MKTITLIASLFIASNTLAQPVVQNQQARQQFQTDKYGMFIHWGLSSMLADYLVRWALGPNQSRRPCRSQLTNNITDRNYKSVKQVVQLLVGAAGRDANLLLNVGPMPTGLIQSEFTDTLATAGKWLQQYGESVYGTRG